jgi:hypothetical protein
MYEVLDILQDDQRSFEQKIADLNGEERKASSSQSGNSKVSLEDTTPD